MDKVYTYSIDDLYHSEFSTKMVDKFSFFFTIVLSLPVLINFENWKVSHIVLIVVLIDIRALEEVITLNLYFAQQKKNKVDKSVNFVDNHSELCKSPSFSFHSYYPLSCYELIFFYSTFVKDSV